MGLTEAATRKVGPLPAWGWGAVIVGGYIAYRFVSGGGSDGTTGAGVPSWAGGVPDGSGGGGGGGASGSTGDTAVLDALAAIRAAIAAIPGPGSSGGGWGASDGAAPGAGLIASPTGSGPSWETTLITDLAGNVISWSEYQAQKLAMIAANPAASYSEINAKLVEQYGGQIFKWQGPEEVLTGQQYSDIILGGWAGSSANQEFILSSPNVGMNTILPSGVTGYQEWLNYLLRVGPEGYVGVNSGQRDDSEYYRNLEIAKQNAAAGMAVATGFVSGSPPTISTGISSGTTGVTAPTSGGDSTPMTLTQFSALNRQGVIDRAKAANIDYNTVTVNQTIQSNYQRYLAGLTG